MTYALLAAAWVQSPTSRITVLDAKNKPLANVQVYGTRFWFERDALSWGKTDHEGQVTGDKISKDTFVLALASDGSIGESIGSSTVHFSRAGTVEVCLKDGGEGERSVFPNSANLPGRTARKRRGTDAAAQ